MSRTVRSVHVPEETEQLAQGHLRNDSFHPDKVQAVWHLPQGDRSVYGWAPVPRMRITWHLGHVVTVRMPHHHLARLVCPHRHGRRVSCDPNPWFEAGLDEFIIRRPKEPLWRHAHGGLLVVARGHAIDQKQPLHRLRRPSILAFDYRLVCARPAAPPNHVVRRRRPSLSLRRNPEVAAAPSSLAEDAAGKPPPEPKTPPRPPAMPTRTTPPRPAPFGQLRRPSRSRRPNRSRQTCSRTGSPVATTWRRRRRRRRLSLDPIFSGMTNAPAAVPDPRAAALSKGADLLEICWHPPKRRGRPLRGTPASPPQKAEGGGTFKIDVAAAALACVCGRPKTDHGGGGAEVPAGEGGSAHRAWSPSSTRDIRTAAPLRAPVTVATPGKYDASARNYVFFCFARATVPLAPVVDVQDRLRVLDICATIQRPAEARELLVVVPPPRAVILGNA